MYPNTRKTSRLFILCLVIGSACSAQSLISGTINTYTDITLVGPCANKLTVSNATGFTAGNTVIIIQMQGATIDETNTAAFGTISAYNSAGLWEKAIIASVVGNTITLTKNLLNSYATTGHVQLVRVPSYTDATVTGTLTGNAWNGTSGGVIALEVTGTLLLNSDIDASGIGFRGGANTQVCPNNCSFGTNETAYYYPTTNYRGAYKGEGIAVPITGKELGRGAQANGGGGGNDHNNGGAGGGNYGTGGQGGNNAEPGAFNCKGNNNYGRPGLALNYASLTKLFPGGGGGAGHGNNGPTGGCLNSGYSGPGGNGGGIVIILGGGTVNGNGHAIIATGTRGGNGGGDGAGGGGAGGAIFISAGSYLNALTLDVQGGEGGDSENFTSNRCIGPGGGGGAGIVLSNSVLPGNVTSLLNGGNSGIVTLSTNACQGSSLTATDGGSAGSTLSGATVPQGFSGPAAGCGLPVTFIHFSGREENKQIVLKWATATEYDADYFSVERSRDRLQFTPIGQVIAAGNTTSRTDYSFTDASPNPGRNYYRLRQVDITGYEKLTTIIGVDLVVAELVKTIYPNPLESGAELMIEFSDPEKQHWVRLTDINGRMIMEWIKPGNNLTVEKRRLPPTAAGIYLLEVWTEEEKQVLKLVAR